MLGSSIEISREIFAACRPKMRKRRSQSLRSSDCSVGNQTRREPREAGRSIREAIRMRKSKAARQRQRARRDARRRDSELLPERVPFSATPRENLDDRDIRHWASRAAWTDRMLVTLVERRLKHGKWHSLFDKLTSELNLFQAARKVTTRKKAAGKTTAKKKTGKKKAATKKSAARKTTARRAAAETAGASGD